mgnify:CR=1 FL=1
MLAIHKQNKAEKDLIAIWIYSFEQWGVPQADKYLDHINVALESIALNPESGVKIDNIKTGYYKYQVKKHIIFYKIVEPRLLVVRVLKSDMDYQSHL